jgi:thiol-disulfide isomerase/thioredoxin
MDSLGKFVRTSLHQHKGGGKMALTTTPHKIDLVKCPDFSLPSVDGTRFEKKSLLNGKPFLVMFICNHCPYVQAIENRLVQLGKDLQNKGINMVAISSNDHPEDTFALMAERARSKSYSFPYLHDETQQVAKAFGAVCTPDVFLFDAHEALRYRGRLDDSWKDEAKVTRRELYSAAMALLAQEPIPEPVVPSMGCSIKWKGDRS